jgi:transcriptional regulator of acetoin/glycerol metabolism
LPPEVRNPSAYNLPATPMTGYRARDKNGEITREELFAVLTQTDWNVAKAARRLGIARNTLYQKLRMYKLERPATV